MPKPAFTPVFVALLFLSFLGAAPPAKEKVELPEQRAVQAQLDRTLPEVSFDNIALGDVVEFLRDVTNANLFVNWKALEDAGIDRNTAVTVRLRNVKFSKALHVILDQVAGGGPKKLDYAVDGGVITVSTADDLAHNTVTRVYDVRDLMRQGEAGGDGAKREAAAIKLLTDSIDPASWREHGGQVGSVRVLNGQLVVTQSPENHKAVANLLKQTRTLLGLPPKDEGHDLTIERR